MRTAPELKQLPTEDVTLSAVTQTIVINYTKYHEVSIQLDSLQNWIREQQRLWNKNRD